MPEQPAHTGRSHGDPPGLRSGCSGQGGSPDGLPAGGESHKMTIVITKHSRASWGVRAAGDQGGGSVRRNHISGPEKKVSCSWGGGPEGGGWSQQRPQGSATLSLPEKPLGNSSYYRTPRVATLRRGKEAVASHSAPPPPPADSSLTKPFLALALLPAGPPLPWPPTVAAQLT